MKQSMKRLLTGLMALVCCLTLVGTGALAGEEQPLRIAALKGPTGIGLVGLLENPAYEIELMGAPDQVVALVASGQVDIAAIPSNLAPTLYQRLDKGVQLLALNTLGVLYVIEEGDSVQSIEDLAGQELFATGQGAMPEYVLNYILAQNGLTEDVTVTYKAEHSELATLAAAGSAKLALLPEPHVTAALMQNPDLRIALDLTEEFSKAQAAQGEVDAVLSMGVLIVRREVLAGRPDAVKAFLSDAADSVRWVLAEPEAAAEQVAAHGILPSAQVALRAIPNCNIVLIAGEEMRPLIEPLFALLYQAEPASIGGEMPDDDFYADLP